ncbi:hypothetical protein [Kitasatospora sp. HPMI-4]|uniref:hypothetical protein n=1 Tax=Kitasatospora sp. HPMI-4 TaxID=3448443 RepID=UPI003F1A762C
MESESLNAEDHVSVHRAVQVLSDRYPHVLTLTARLGAWAELVASVEEGFDAVWAWEFEEDVADRDWLHDAWPILTERVRRLCRPELDALDRRFRAATAPIGSPGAGGGAVAAEGRWWQSRYPLRVSGDPRAELPPTWSPAPTYVG